jgi:hypothetical protein
MMRAVAALVVAAQRSAAVKGLFRVAISGY